MRVDQNIKCQGLAPGLCWVRFRVYLDYMPITARALDFAEWIGEHRTLLRLREKMAAVRGLRIED